MALVADVADPRWRLPAISSNLWVTETGPDSDQERPMTRTTTPRRDDAGSRQSAPENRSRAATAAYPTKNDLEDADSADILSEISRGVDKWLWFVEAHQQGG